MNVVVSTDTVPRNRLLSSMKAAEFERLRPSIATVSLALGESLNEAGTTPDYVYFPNTAVLGAPALG